jgi:hypothetical protein
MDYKDMTSRQMVESGRGPSTCYWPSMIPHNICSLQDLLERDSPGLVQPVMLSSFGIFPCVCTTECRAYPGQGPDRSPHARLVSLQWARGGILEETTKLLPQLEAGKGHDLSLGHEMSLRYPDTRPLCSDVGDNNLSTRRYTFLFRQNMYLSWISHVRRRQQQGGIDLAEKTYQLGNPGRPERAMGFSTLCETACGDLDVVLPSSVSPFPGYETSRHGCRMGYYRVWRPPPPLLLVHVVQTRWASAGGCVI